MYCKVECKLCFSMPDALQCSCSAYRMVHGWRNIKQPLVDVLFFYAHCICPIIIVWMCCQLVGWPYIKNKEGCSHKLSSSWFSVVYKPQLSSDTQRMLLNVWTPWISERWWMDVWTHRYYVKDGKCRYCLYDVRPFMLGLIMIISLELYKIYIFSWYRQPILTCFSLSVQITHYFTLSYFKKLLAVSRLAVFKLFSSSLNPCGTSITIIFLWNCKKNFRTGNNLLQTNFQGTNSHWLHQTF